MTDRELNPCMECGGTDCVVEADITRRFDGFRTSGLAVRRLGGVSGIASAVTTTGDDGEDHEHRKQGHKHFL